MAIKGLSTFVYGKLVNETAKTYMTPAKLSGAIEATPTVNFNTAPIYSDNRLKHKDVSFSDGSLLLTVDYEDKEILSPLFGRTVEDVSFTPAGEDAEALTLKKHISKSSDISVPQGFGYIIDDFDVDNKKNVYVVRFFYKVEFAPALTTVRTKEGNTAYTYSQLSGTIFELSDKSWMEETDFDELSAAVEYLNSLFKAAI